MKSTELAQPYDIGTPASKNSRRWVQTERAAHEAMGLLALKNPKAIAVLHRLISLMGHQNAVVIGQDVLAHLVGISLRSVSRAIAALATEKWIEIINVGKGTTRAYIVNDRVAWGQPRDQLRLSVFSAQVIADWNEQDPALLGNGALRHIPTLFHNEQQLPSGPGEPPPSQPFLSDMEPDLPALTAQEDQ
jgi:hypothetical protein